MNRFGLQIPHVTQPMLLIKLNLCAVCHGGIMDQLNLREAKESFADSSTADSTLFLQVFDKQVGKASTDRDYGVPSPARIIFNEAFKEFQNLSQTQSPEEALSKSSSKMIQSIDAADDYTERAQDVFYAQVSKQHMQNGKPDAQTIEKLQILSATLTSVMPGDRENLMRDLSKGNTSKLIDYDDVRQRYEDVAAEFAATNKNALIKSWFDYRAGIGDSIGQRQVFIGLQRRFGSESVADSHEDKVTEYKNRIGGRFVFD